MYLKNKCHSCEEYICKEGWTGKKNCLPVGRKFNLFNLDCGLMGRQAEMGQRRSLYFTVSTYAKNLQVGTQLPKHFCSSTGRRKTSCKPFHCWLLKTSKFDGAKRIEFCQKPKISITVIHPQTKMTCNPFRYWLLKKLGAKVHKIIAETSMFCHCSSKWRCSVLRPCPSYQSTKLPKTSNFDGDERIKFCQKPKFSICTVVHPQITHKLSGIFLHEFISPHFWYNKLV